ncbi:hypothetical protein [Mangrovivirga cuniculi]|uniref:Lipoprotein n=1 Tax=Mangrovivirga cuniculi TaxID=2715131 RepID=A0A4D7JQS8_9BACT|nr:hypothetical protein [Mangrovivirga cuniculi]QCK13345.1 hypothetical protein DCC35_00560 [Mangrovivirga cuniculi]
MKSGMIPVWVIFLLFLFCSCQKEKIKPSEDTDGIIITSLKSEPSLNNFFHSPNSRLDFSTLGELNFKKFVKTVTSSGKTTYSIPLYPENPLPYSREYLILNKINNGYRAYIIQYSSDNLSSLNDLEKFNGTFRILDMERNIKYEACSEQGRLISSSDMNSRTSETYELCNCYYVPVTEVGDFGPVMVLEKKFMILPEVEEMDHLIAIVMTLAMLMEEML